MSYQINIASFYGCIFDFIDLLLNIFNFGSNNAHTTQGFPIKVELIIRQQLRFV